jgi:hypothetical protein
VLTAFNLASSNVDYDLIRDIDESTRACRCFHVYAALSRARPAPAVMFFYGERWCSGLKQRTALSATRL